MVQTTRADTHAVLLQRLRVLAVGQDGRGVGEFAETGDGQVLLVAALTDDLVLGLYRMTGGVSTRTVLYRRAEQKLAARTEGRT